MRQLDQQDDESEYDEDEPGTFREVVVTIIAALVLAYVVQGFLVKPYRIPSGSMENTLHCSDRVLVDRVSYHLGEPKRLDVVVFHPPAGVDENGRPDPTQIADGNSQAGRDRSGNRVLTKADVNYIKRIVGMPGDRVEVHSHHAVVNGKKIDEPYLHPLPRDQVTSESEYGPVTVPKGTYLMLGDHRDNSADGRFFGFVPREFVIGKAFFVYWPPKRIGGLPDRDPGGAAASRPDPNCLESIPEPEPQPAQADGD